MFKGIPPLSSLKSLLLQSGFQHLKQMHMQCWRGFELLPHGSHKTLSNHSHGHYQQLKIGLKSFLFPLLSPEFHFLINNIIQSRSLYQDYGWP